MDACCHDLLLYNSMHSSEKWNTTIGPTLELWQAVDIPRLYAVAPPGELINAKPPLYAVVFPGESQYSLINHNLQSNSGELVVGGGLKSKIEDQRLINTLVIYHHVKNLPIPSGYEAKKKHLFLLLWTHRQTRTQTHRHSGRLRIAQRSVDQQRELCVS